MPEVPGIIERVNYVKDFICDPCDAPFIVYVETFLPAFGQLLLEWYSFGLDDIIRGYFRPAGLVSHGHKRRLADRKKRRKKNKLIRALEEIIGFEPGEVIAKNLPLQQKMRFRKISDGVRHLWIIDSIMQRAFYYWMVIDLVTEFAYKWTSLLMKTEYCQASKRYFLLTQCEEQIIAGNPGDYRISIGEVVKKRGDVIYSPIEIVLPGPGTVICAGRIEPYKYPDFPTASGHIKLIGKWALGSEEIAISEKISVSDDVEKGGLVKANVNYNYVQPVFTIVGSADTFYAAYLKNFTLVAVGSE